MVVRSENDLGLGTGAELVSVRLELLSQLNVVVDLPVVEDAVPIAAISHWLAAVAREIENRQPAMAQSDILVVPGAGVIRPSVDEVRSHGCDAFNVGRTLKVDDPGKAAHVRSLASAVPRSLGFMPCRRRAHCLRPRRGRCLASRGAL